MGAQKLIHTEFLYTQGAQKLIPTKFSTLLRTQGAQKFIRTKFSTNKVVSEIRKKGRGASQKVGFK